MPSSCDNRNSHAVAAKKQPNTTASAVMPCTAGANWDQDCVKKILCSNLKLNSSFVSDLAGIEVHKAEGLVGVTVEYDGTKWNETKTSIDGVSGIINGTKIIYLKGNQTCEQAAVTLFHEYQHILSKNEIEAYGLTEEWGMQQQPRLTHGNQVLLDGGMPDVCYSEIRGNEPTMVSVERIKKHLAGPLYAIHDTETVFDHYDKPRAVGGGTESWSKVRVAGKEIERPSKKGDRHPSGMDYKTEVLQDAAKWQCP